MSWIENANRDFTITTGDGVRYTVNWLVANKTKDFNVSIFNFRGKKGSLVDRREPIGAIFDIEIYFQGEDNIETSDRFDKSSSNKKAWRISHPIYGILNVHPLSLKFDNSTWNVTKITGQVMETNEQFFFDGAKTPTEFTNISPLDTIQAKKLNTDLTMANSYVAEVPIPNAIDIREMKVKISTADRLQQAFATTKEDIESAINTYNAANSFIDAAASNAFAAIRSVQAVLDLPANFTNTVLNRINFLRATADALYTSVTGLNTNRLKKLYENVIGCCITTTCAASVTNIAPADYRYRTSVVQVIDIIGTMYDDYILNLDTLQSPNGGDVDSYVPDFNSLNDLGNIVKYTLSNLFSIADNAQQQRTLTLSSDNNLITLAYEIYGLQPDDSTIEQLITDNNIGRSEMLQIKKGREIIYYI